MSKLRLSLINSSYKHETDGMVVSVFFYKEDRNKYKYIAQEFHHGEEIKETVKKLKHFAKTLEDQK